MLILKLIFHLNAWFKTGFYRMIYGRKFRSGKSFTFRKGFSLIIGHGGQVRIGDGCFFNNYCTVASICSVEIGHHTIFGENVKIYDHNHRFSDPSLPIKRQGYTSAPVKIGNHCWIASNVVILKGVTIGDHCVVGAGCIVYRDVSPGTTLINRQTCSTLK